MLREPYLSGARGELRLCAMQDWAKASAVAPAAAVIQPSGELEYEQFIVKRASVLKIPAEVDRTPLFLPSEAACLLEPHVLLRPPGDQLKVRSGGRNDKIEILH